MRKEFVSHLPINYFGALKAAVDTFLLVFLGLFCLALTSFSYASLLDLGALRSFQQRCRNFFCFHFDFLWHSLTIHERYHPVINKKICFDVEAFLELERYCKLSASFIRGGCRKFCLGGLNFGSERTVGLF